MTIYGSKEFQSRGYVEIPDKLKGNQFRNEKYCNEVAKSVEYYEHLNAQAETKVTYLSTEELKKYNQPKAESVHKLKLKEADKNEHLHQDKT